MARPGRTYGRPNSAVGVKWYFKPSMGRMIGRIPGVVRKSASVLAVNEILEGKANSPEHPASRCHGREWKAFLSCLRAEMKKIVTPDAIRAKAGRIAEQYNIPVSTKRTPVWKKAAGE